MAQHHGTRHYLQKLLGWYQEPPRNITQEEAKRAMAGQADSVGNNQADPVGLSSDPLKRFEMLSAMARSELMAPLIELYAEEATQPDITRGKTLWYECNDSAVEKELNEMLDRVHCDDYIFSIAASIAGTGNSYQRVLWTTSEGITHLVGTPVNHVLRLWHPTTRKLLGFKWMGEKPQYPIYENADDVFAPWDFVHFRRVYSSDTEYGQGLLDHMYPIWKKLAMATDQMVLYRLHTMPTRYVFKIDVGNADFTDAMEQTHLWKMFMRQQMGMQQQTPGLAGLQSRFDPAAVDSFMIFPVRSGEDKSSVDTLQGDKDIPDIQDIEYLEKVIIGGSRIPKGYLGREEGSGLAQASLVSQDIRFARMIRVLRRPIIAGFYRLAQLHLAFKGHDPAKFKISVKMSKISSIEEEVNMGTLEKQANLASTITQLCRDLGIPNREIIDLVFREYLSVPRYFLDVAKLSMGVQRALSGQLGGGDSAGGGMGGMPMSSMGSSLEGGDLSGGGGMDGGDLPPLDDLDLEPAGDSLTASRKLVGHKGTLLIEATTHHEAGILRKVLESIQASVKDNANVKTLTEGTAETPESRKVKENLYLVRQITQDMIDIGVTKRVSLVEGDTSGDAVPPTILTQLTESVNLTTGACKARKKMDIPDDQEIGGEEELHEAAASVKRARQAERTRKKAEEKKGA